MINKQSWAYKKVKYAKYYESYRKENCDKKKLYDKNYRAKNKTRIAKYRELTKEARNLYSCKYRAKNKDKLRVYNKIYLRKYTKDRAERDPLFKLTIRIRTLLGNAIRNKGYRKVGHTRDILGCTYDEFKVWLENLFKDGMSWDNYGKWEIDHKIPLASATSSKQLLELNHYTNLQPLWKEDNLLKRYE